MHKCLKKPDGGGLWAGEDTSVLEDSEHGAWQLSAYVLLHPFTLLSCHF